LLGAARTLVELKDRLRGRVRFLFQPAEEISRGAMEMIEAGVLFDRVPDAMFTLHTWPKLPVGHVGSRPGTITAGSDSFAIRVIGEGGHGARPHLARNPLLGMSHLIEALSSMTAPNRVVSPCVAHAGSKVNVIPELGEISGTVRTLNEEIRRSTLQEIEETVGRLCEDRGLECEIDFDAGCPPVVVDAELYQLFSRVGRELLGDDRVERLDSSSMGSEDFGHYLTHVPGLLFRLGMGLDSPELHNPRFDFNDDALESGITMLVGLALAVTCGNGFLTG
jgi:amidohydrolase